MIDVRVVGVEGGATTGAGSGVELRMYESRKELGGDHAL